MILQAFCDDSTTNEIYIIAGYLAPLQVWESIVSLWHRVLKDERPRLGCYRTSDAIALKGEFEHFDESSRNERIAALAKVIPRDTRCIGLASWVSKADFATYCHSAFHPAWHDPYYLCATWLIEQVCDDVNGLAPRKLDFFFDRQGKVGVRFEAVYDVVLKPILMQRFPFLGDVRHEDKHEFLPLQVADMQAGWVRRTSSTIQIWTSADIHLSKVPQRHYPIPRAFLEYIARYSREHEDVLSAWREKVEAWAKRPLPRTPKRRTKKH